jgi:hypothetical protein
MGRIIKWEAFNEQERAGREGDREGGRERHLLLVLAEVIVFDGSNGALQRREETGGRVGSERRRER